MTDSHLFLPQNWTTYYKKKNKMSTLFAAIKEILSSLSTCLISVFIFLLLGDMLRDLFQCPPTMPSDFNPVRLIGIFYVFPFCLAAVFFGKNSLLRWGRLALFLFVSFFLWDKNTVVDSMAVETAFLLSFACLLGLEKAKNAGTFRSALFKIATGVMSYVVFSIPIALGMRGLLWGVVAGSASDYMFEVYGFSLFLPICLALPFVTHIVPLRVVLIAIAMIAPLLGVSYAGVFWVILYISAMVLSIVFSQLITSGCHLMNSGAHH